MKGTSEKPFFQPPLKTDLSDKKTRLDRRWVEPVLRSGSVTDRDLESVEDFLGVHDKRPMFQGVGNLVF